MSSWRTTRERMDRARCKTVGKEQMMYGLTPEAAEARQATTFEAIQREVGSCREWVEEKNTRCGAPSEYVLWGKLLPAEALGPRCYDCAAKHVGRRALADPAYALLDLWRLARVIDEAHLAAYRCPGGGVSEPERVTLRNKMVEMLRCRVGLHRLSAWVASDGGPDAVPMNPRSRPGPGDTRRCVYCGARWEGAYDGASPFWRRTR